MQDKEVNKSWQWINLNWPPSVEWRYLGKCGGNSVNQITRNRCDWGLNVGHAQRHNMPETLPKPYQPREKSILPKRGNTSIIKNHQGYLGARQIWNHHLQELPTCYQEENYCGSFACITWGEKGPKESIRRHFDQWIYWIYDGTVCQYHQTN